MGECFFWYRPTWVVPDQRPLNGRCCCCCLSVFSCTVLFVSISQVIGCEDRLRNDLYCVGWGVKLYSNQTKVGSVNKQLLIEDQLNVQQSDLFICSFLSNAGENPRERPRRSSHACFSRDSTSASVDGRHVYQNGRLCQKHGSLHCRLSLFFHVLSSCSHN